MTGRSFVTIGLVAVIVLAIASAGWFGYRLATAASDAEQALAEARDAALAEGSDALVTLNTLHHRTAEEDIARWRAVSTGSLREQLDAGKKDLLAAVREAESTTTAEIVQVALTEVDEGTARLMAVVDIDVRPAGEEPTTKRARYAADLVATDGQWRLAGLAPVVVGN